MTLSSKRCLAPAARAWSSSSFGADFDFHRDRSPARAFESRSYASSRRDVIILDQNGVEKTRAMVRRAPGGYRHFFELPQPRRGFARIENFRSRAFDRVDVGMGERRDAAQALEEVESSAFASKQGAGRATHDSDLGTVHQVRTGVALQQDLTASTRNALSDLFKDRQQKFDACENQLLPRDETAGGGGIGRNAEVRSDIARANIFG